MSYDIEIAGIQFASLASGDGQYSLCQIQIGVGRYDNVRYHLKGVKGSYTSEGGLIGVPITARVRYVGDVVDLYNAFEADKATMEGAPGFDIEDPAGNIYEDCELEDAVITRHPTATGRVGGQTWMDVEYRFTSWAGKAAA
ncbi:MAG: hypothetical protein M5U26_08480 [Planctomycetota bacterium]|nr:hypothetical protein [Planctomycetota bacterium]